MLHYYRDNLVHAYHVGYNKEKRLLLSGVFPYFKTSKLFDRFTEHLHDRYNNFVIHEHRQKEVDYDIEVYKDIHLMPVVSRIKDSLESRTLSEVKADYEALRRMDSADFKLWMMSLDKNN